MSESKLLPMSRPPTAQAAISVCETLLPKNERIIWQEASQHQLSISCPYNCTSRILFACTVNAAEQQMIKLAMSALGRVNASGGFMYCFLRAIGVKAIWVAVRPSGVRYAARPWQASG